MREGSRRETRRTETAAADARRRPRAAPRACRASSLVAVRRLHGRWPRSSTSPRVHPDEPPLRCRRASLAEGEGLTPRGRRVRVRARCTPPSSPRSSSVTRDREPPTTRSRPRTRFSSRSPRSRLPARAPPRLGPWWSVGVAALSVAIPSSIYVSVVMTESASLTSRASLALLAIVLALERPTVARQLAVLGARSASPTSRAPQFGRALRRVRSLALVARLADPSRRARAASAQLDARCWPTLGGVALGVPRLPRGAARRRGRRRSARTAALARLRPARRRASGPLYHLADLEIYLAVVPLAVAPIVLWQLCAPRRAGRTREAASLRSSSRSTPRAAVRDRRVREHGRSAYDRLHDRNIFYLAPLWLILFAVWLADGLPRPLVATAIGAGSRSRSRFPSLPPHRGRAGSRRRAERALGLAARAARRRGAALGTPRLRAPSSCCSSSRRSLCPRRCRLGAARGRRSPSSSRHRRARLGAAWSDAPENDVFAGGLERAWIDDARPGRREREEALPRDDRAARPRRSRWHSSS